MSESSPEPVLKCSVTAFSKQEQEQLQRYLWRLALGTEQETEALFLVHKYIL